MAHPHPAVRPLHGTQRRELEVACDAFKQVYVKARGYEPALIWCMNQYDELLSTQINAASTAQSSGTDQERAVNRISDMLLRYTQLIEALEKMQNRRVPGGRDERSEIDYHGQRRHISCNHDNEANDRFFDLFSNTRYIGEDRTAWLAKTVERCFGKRLTNVLGRIVVGTTAGASLLVPMIIMSFETSRTARLIIVSLFTLGFGFTVGMASPSTDTVIAATAAYAAVMVVYIGSAERA